MRRQVVLAFIGTAFAACAGQGGGGGGGFDGGGFGDGGGGGDGTMDTGHADAPGHPDVINLDGAMADVTCAAEKYTAQSAPASMLFVLDASGTMGQSAGGSSTKWANAQQAIVTAMDLPVFDTVSLGLLTYPQPSPGGKELAMCPILMSLGVHVNCEVSGLPQVPLTLAGTGTTSTPGVRMNIYDALVAASPAAGPGNGNPGYDALMTGITTLQAATTTKRLLFFITDGGASCTSQDTPQRPYYKDGNGCDDWEDPDNIVTMLQTAHDDKTTPINTLVVGVQGADTTGAGPMKQNPPYSVRLALSAYALAGSPETVPTGCDGTYTQAGTDPAVPCHFDLSTTPSFGTVLSTDIATIRDQLLGCTYTLPKPEAGTVDMSKINVEVGTGSGKPTEIYRRNSTKDACTTGAGCWDYGPGGEIELIGNACTDVQKSLSAKVEILVGCETIVK
jgi:hypothetical protein